MSTLLELRGVEKRYDHGTLALERVNLAIGMHEFVSLLGPSGCGKCTALKMIAGLSEYVLVFTTLEPRVEAAQVMALYRLRWQIELEFKRLKSLIEL